MLGDKGQKGGHKPLSHGRMYPTPQSPTQTLTPARRMQEIKRDGTEVLSLRSQYGLNTLPLHTILRYFNAYEVFLTP